MLDTSRPVRLAAAAAIALLVFIAGCTDDTSGPGTPRAGRLALTPDFGVLRSGIIDIARGRFVLTRIPGGAVAADTVIAIASDADSVALGIQVLVFNPGETFNLTIRLIDTNGDTAFAAGPIEVSPSTSTTPVPVEVPFTYVGTGFNAERVLISSPDTSTFTGESVLLSAMAVDSNDTPIPGTPIGWESLDTARVGVTTDAQDRGVATGGSQRGVARIVATLVTGQTDTVLVSNQPLPTTIVAESGSNQSARADSTLPLPLVARVTAADGLGVRGLWVRFVVTSGGGSVSADSVRTDSTGRASVDWTLARSFQPQVVTATTARLGTASAMFTATLVFEQPATLEIVAGDGQGTTVGTAVAIAPQVRVRDASGLPVPGVVVTFAVTGGGGIVAGGTPVTDTLGLAAVTSWTLGTAAGFNRLRATVNALAVTFDATALPGPAVRLVFTGEPTTVAQDSVIRPPVEVTAYDAFDNIATDFLAAVEVALLANPGGAVLRGTTDVSAYAGIATFGDLTLSAAGVGYTLLATSSGLTPDTSAAFEVLAPVRQIRWNNAEGGSWETASNWDLGRVPTAEDSVTIDLAGSYTVAVTTNSATAAHLTLASGPMLRIGAANHTSLTVASGLLNAGTILLTNDGLNANASLSVTAGTLSSTGVIEATAGSGAGSRTVTAAIENQGTISATSFNLTIVNTGRTFSSTAGALATPNGNTLTVSGGTVRFGSLTQLSGTGVFSLPPTTLLELASDFTLAAGTYRLDLSSSGLSVNGPGTFIVEDTIAFTADTINAPVLLVGPLEVRGTTSYINGPLAIDPTGLLRIGDAGHSALVVADGFTNGGQILLTNDGLNAGASLTVASGTLLNTGIIQSAVGAGAGTRTITGAVQNQNLISAGSHDLTIFNTGRTFTGTSGTLATPNGNTLTIAGGTVQLGAETGLSGRGVFFLPAGTLLELPTEFTLASGDYRLDLAGAGGIAVNGPGRLFAQDTLVLEADTVNSPLTVVGRVEAREPTSFINGAMAIGPGALLRIGAPGHAALVVADGFTNDGTILLTNDGLNANATLTVSAGVLVNDGLIEATQGAGSGGRSVTGAVDNAGIISATSFSLTIVNTGRTFTSTSGALATPNGHTLALSGGTVRFGSGTALSGRGVFSLPATTLLELPTGFTLPAGDYRLDLAGTAGISVNGPGAFTVADTLVLAGDTINAPLAVTGRLEARAPTAVINGGLDVQTGGLLRIGDPGHTTLTVASPLTNAGTITLTNDGLNANAILEVTAGPLLNAGLVEVTQGVGSGSRAIAGDLDHRGTLTITYPFSLVGRLISPAGAPGVVTGNGSTLPVVGLDVDGLTFDNAPLASTGGAITRFDNVTFQNMGTTAVQLTVNHPGAATPFTFTGVRFLTTPTTGRYIRANDTNTSDGTPLTIDLAGATPTDGSAYEEELNGAVVNWIPVPGVNDWLGGDGLWSNTARWSLGRVPIPGDTVRIITGEDYTVTLDQNATVATLLLGAADPGARLVATGYDLTVTDASANPGLEILPFSWLELGESGLFADRIMNQGTIGGGDALIQTSAFTNLGTLHIRFGEVTVAHATGYDLQTSGTIQVDDGARLTLGTNGGLTYLGGTITGGGSGTGVIRLSPFVPLVLGADLTYDNLIIESVDGSVIRQVAQTLTVGQFAQFRVGGDLTRILAPVAVNGIVDIQNGTLEIAAAAALNPTGVLRGVGVLDATGITGTGALAGTISPGNQPGALAGVFTWVGDFAPDPGAVLDVDLGGYQAGTQHDRLDVQGAVELDGTLRVTLQNGFVPGPGDRFPIMTFEAAAFGFATLQFPDLGGLRLDTLTVVSGTVADTLYLVASAVAAPIVFAGDSAGGLSTGVFRVDPDGNALSRLFSFTPIAEVYPRWAPDRSRIVFTFPIEGAGTENALRAISADGTTFATVASDTSMRRPRFSPDGRHLAFECGDGSYDFSFGPQDVCVLRDVPADVASMSGIGNGLGKYLTDSISGTLGGSGAFAWNPQNPDQLAVVRDPQWFVGGPLTSEIWLVNVDGSNAQSLTGPITFNDGPLRVVSMDWAPGGGFIAFEAIDTQSVRAIYRVELGDGTITQLTTAGAQFIDDWRPVVSPDDSEILFARAGDGYSLYRIPSGTPNAEIRVTPLFNLSPWNGRWDWSPDGSAIVHETSYLEDGTSTGDIMVATIPRGTVFDDYIQGLRIVGRTRGTGSYLEDRQPSWRP